MIVSQATLKHVMNTIDALPKIEGVAYIDNMKELSEKTSLCPMTIQRTISELKASGHISVDRKTRITVN